MLDKNSEIRNTSHKSWLWAGSFNTNFPSEKIFPERNYYRLIAQIGINKHHLNSACVRHEIRMLRVTFITASGTGSILHHFFARRRCCCC